MCMNGYFMKEAFLFNGDPSIVGIYSGFTSFSIPEALKQAIGSNHSKYEDFQCDKYTMSSAFAASAVI